jgi:hypothetical protein
MRRCPRDIDHVILIHNTEVEFKGTRPNEFPVVSAFQQTYRHVDNRDDFVLHVITQCLFQ